MTYDHKQLINQSCIFVLSARIEDFTNNLFENLFYKYKTGGAQLHQIPKNARTKLLIDRQVQHYRNFYNSSDERTLLRNIAIDNSFYEVIDNNHVFNNQIHKSNIIGTNKYPSVKNLKILYHRIGINNIITDLNRKSKKDLQTPLESFLSLRESIAHQGAPAITYNDIVRHFKNISELIGYLDRIVYSHIVNISGNQFW